MFNRFAALEYFDVLKYGWMEIAGSRNVTFSVVVRIAGVQNLNSVRANEPHELGGGNDFVRYHESVIPEFPTIQQVARHSCDL